MGKRCRWGKKGEDEKEEDQKSKKMEVGDQEIRKKEKE
jgi:hypothetical protein